MKLSLASLLAYRVNFINGIFSSLVWSIFGMLATFLLTSKTQHIFGWSRNELLVLTACYNIFFGVFYMFFSRNFAEMTRIIHFGQLDTYLLRPIDSQFSLTCWTQGFYQITRVVVGTLFLFYILSLMHVHVTPWSVLFFLLLFIFGIMIMYSIWFMILTITIWFTNLSNLVDFMYSVNIITKYPQEMYKGFSEYLFLALFPLTLVLVIPVKEILHKILLSDIFILLIVAVIMLFISRHFWKFALRFYTSASG